MGRRREFPDPPAGARFGSWTVIGPAPPPATRPYERRVTCRYKCGVTQRVNVASLYRGTSIRCAGCADAARREGAGRRALVVKTRRKP